MKLNELKDFIYKIYALILRINTKFKNIFFIFIRYLFKKKPIQKIAEKIFYRYLLKLYSFNLQNNDIKLKKNRFVFTIGTLLDGGAEKQLLNLAIFLKKNYNIKCIIIINNYENISKKNKKIIKDNYFKILSIDNLDSKIVERYLLKKKIFLKEEKIFYTSTIIKKYYYIFHKLNPSKVINFLDPPNCLSGMASVMQNIKTYNFLRSLNPTNFNFNRLYFKPYYHLLLKFKNVTFISNSKAGLLNYIEWIGLNNEKLNFFCIENLIDNNKFFFEKNFVQKKKLFKKFFNIRNSDITIGSLIKYDHIKRPYQLLKIFSELAKLNRNYKFFIITDNKFKLQFENLAKQFLNLDLFNFQIISFNNDYIYKGYYLLDYFILTSKVEGYPNVLVEAQMMNNFVFSYDVGGALETLAPGNFSKINFSKNALAEAIHIDNVIKKNHNYKLDFDIRKNFFNFYQEKEVHNKYKKIFNG